MTSVPPAAANTDAQGPPAAPAAPMLGEATLPAEGRSRARAAVLLLATGVAALPWHGAQAGPERAGAPLALGLLAAWGLAGGLLLARTRRGLRVAEAAASAAVAASLAALVVVAHPWLPGAVRRPSWAAVFAPLAALALLDLGRLLSRRALGAPVAAVRGWAAVAAAAALFAADEDLAGWCALGLSLAPLASSRPSTARGARRALEGLSVAVALVLFLAPDLGDAIVPRAPSADVDTLGVFAFRLAALGVAALSLAGLRAPEGESASDPPSR